jgi:hypothetical protein
MHILFKIKGLHHWQLHVRPEEENQWLLQIDTNKVLLLSKMSYYDSARLYGRVSKPAPTGSALGERLDTSSGDDLGKGPKSLNVSTTETEE